MEKNAFLAVILSALVFIIYFVVVPNPQRVPTPPPQNPPIVQTETQAPLSNPPLLLTPESGPQSVTYETSKLETKVFVSQFSTEAGQALSWEILNFKKTTDGQASPLDLLQNTSDAFPFALLLDTKLVNSFHTVVSAKTDEIIYQTQTPQLAVQKIIRTTPHDYFLEVQVQITNTSSEVLSFVPGLRLAAYNDPHEKPKGFWIFKAPLDINTPLYFIDKSVERLANLDKLPSWKGFMGNILWTGLESRYFLRAIVARTDSMENQTNFGKQGDVLFADLNYPKQTLAPGQSKQFIFTTYLGPKDMDLLKAGGPSLTKAVNLGWFGIIGEPLLWLLKQLHTLLFNSWGLAIIGLTLLVKILLHPVSKKSLKAMKAMQELQPKLQELREKYKTDKQRLNVETMNLFRAHKVNPMGGCLPMLLQMPIYIALYNVFYNSIDLYHTPFLFYKDLAAPDPYYISPILLGIFLFLQQKLTPQANVDPAQQKAMMLMPLLFSFFLLNLPAGLVLYIFINTVMAVAQQYKMNKNISFMKLLKKS
ncbi:MAG: membrane protein insertase YidC [Deltaproteobacteria bacterium]|nr:membrane protein insertase YidC [Deltaproteobacteria bacterium]